MAMQRVMDLQSEEERKRHVVVVVCGTDDGRRHERANERRSFANLWKRMRGYGHSEIKDVRLKTKRKTGTWNSKSNQS